METVEAINKRLTEYFGSAWNGNPIWRVVWSDDQLEKRRMQFSETGLQLLYPEVREVKKYSYIQAKYVLERLVEVPEVSQQELPVLISYEPIWVFEDKNHNALPPIWEAAKFVVDTVYAAIGKKSLANYVESKEDDETRIRKMQEDLFGNETDVSDALAYGNGVAGFHPKKEKVN